MLIAGLCWLAEIHIALTCFSTGARGLVDGDSKFVREFQTTFNSCSWERYVLAVLKKYGFAVDFSKPSPNLVVFLS